MTPEDQAATEADPNAQPAAATETLFGPGPTDEIVDAGARYRDKPVEILRAATDKDSGFIPGRNEAQLLVKHPDGTLQVVFGDQVKNETV